MTGNKVVCSKVVASPCSYFSSMEWREQGTIGAGWCECRGLRNRHETGQRTGTRCCRLAAAAKALGKGRTARASLAVTP